MGIAVWQQCLALHDAIAASDLHWQNPLLLAVYLTSELRSPNFGRCIGQILACVKTTLMPVGRV